ncbi:MAG: amino acid permease [Myxococcales bacterium]|nr:amino acid permease [Myxococcales bacterium]
MSSAKKGGQRRHLDFLQATGVGVGAIVGGGILVLAGVAFRETGPSTILAFALNGALAIMTALSFAEMSSMFPESGGAYTFAKKVLTVRAAFVVGWVLWFAYIVAGVLYALGFAEYAVLAIDALWVASGGASPPWLRGRPALSGLAVVATGAYSLLLIRSNKGGGQIETLGKLIVFAILLAAGAWALGVAPSGTARRGLTPFLEHGTTGLLAAMGFTFIALQGFDLVAAVGGEVKDPERNIPRAMLASLGIALAVYIPFLFLTSTVGVPAGQSISQMSADNPATVMAVAAYNYAGVFGYWLVVVAAILSTLSALSACIFAASRVALRMARDRTLPRVLQHQHPTRGTPIMSIYATALAMAFLLLMVRDVSAAGAAASLIFLISFALVHWTSLLARQRTRIKAPFQTPWFPAIPLIGGLACAVLAAYQAVVVPRAGAVTAVWLGFGVILYIGLFAGRARAVDAFAEAHDPRLGVLRGRSPLVLVPVANPASAVGMVTLANALAIPVVGRVVLLTVVRRPSDFAAAQIETTKALEDANSVVGQALTASLRAGHTPEALMTIAYDPWKEIARVAQSYECESLLMGFSSLEDQGNVAHIEQMLNDVECDVVVVRASKTWTLNADTRIIVPVGGRGGHDELRARLLGSLGRAGCTNVRFVQANRQRLAPGIRLVRERELRIFAEEETRGTPEVKLIESGNMVEALANEAGTNDLIILGLRHQRGKRLFGELALQVARKTDAATLMISRRS